MNVDLLFTMISDAVRGGRTLTEACKHLSQLVGKDGQAVLKEARRKFEEETGRIRTLKRPTALQKRGIPNWYTGPSADDRFWPALKTYLLAEKGWNQETIDSIDNSSTKIVSLLQPPGLAKIDTKGLVVGYVQSGKTANYTAVIAKAADVNYKFFIVLSGMTNSLRSQTQARLERELVDQNREKKWITLTTITDDFRPGPHRNVNAFLTDKSDFKVLCVVKKNAAVLRRLMKWLGTASREVLNSCPVLIIDDEADQASINASRYQDKRTAINKLLLDILSKLPRVAYIGYTATPFANVFIDPSTPEDLYPRDFIVDLPQPKAYFGTERIFGRQLLGSDDSEEEYEGLDVIRLIPESDVSLLKPPSRKERNTFEPELTTSLKKALCYFWMAVAARAARGQSDKHSTMLIHTTLYTDVHERFKPLIERYKKRLSSKLRKGNRSVLQKLREQWEEEQGRLPSAEIDEEATSFDEFAPYLTQVIKKTTLVVDNSRSEQRLSYEDDGQVQIVIGGNTLSRGLTLEGLIVSFFIRTSSAYDTLLQMGRWFGYRQGYADLPRVWLTSELESYFYDLATVEQEIRNDIEYYELRGLTPMEFAVSIRTHPCLNITSRLKMQNAVPAKVSYSGRRVQTVLFKHKNMEWLNNNLKVTRRLIKTIASYIDPSEGQNVLFHNVPVGAIQFFLEKYHFHENSELDSDLLQNYIKAQNNEGELKCWNVVILKRREKEGEELLDLGTGIKVPLLNRSQRIRGDGMANNAHLGVLVSSGDRVADLKLSAREIKGKKEQELQAMRPKEIGLLLIYPISKDSKPPKRKKKNGSPRTSRRVDLEAVQHLIGVALVFPTARRETPVKYLTVELPAIEMEEEEFGWLDEEEETE